MTIKEMHIALDQGVQYLAANRTRAFHPEEKDLILNKMVNRYITSRLRPRGDGSYEVDSLAQEQLKTLIVQRAGIPAEVGNKEYTVTLPSDLGWYITAQAGVQDRSCITTSLIQQVKSRFVYLIKYPLSTRTSPKYYITATLGGVDIAELAQGNNAAEWIGLPSKDQVFEVMAFLTEALRSDMDVYHESGTTLRIVKSTGGQINATADAVSITANPDNIPYHVYDPTIATNPTPIRLVPTVQKFELQGTPYWRSTPQSLLACFVDGNLRIVEPQSSIITDSTVIYVKKPRRLSLALNQNSDLPEDYHGDIVDLAVSYIKLELNKPEWEKTLADNKLNTTI